MPDEMILLVEDNREHALLVHAVLDYRSLAHGVFVTESLGEAQSYLLGEWPFDNPEKTPLPSLIVLDHWLPDGTGLDLLEWLQTQPHLERIPVIVFTACREEEVEARARSYGVADYIKKPEGFEALAEAVDRLLRPWKRSLQEDRMKRDDSEKAG